MGFGGPETLLEVREFLVTLFNDPAIIRLPLGILRSATARWIAARRAPEAARRYQRIGGKSPLPGAVTDLTAKLREHLPYKIWHSFRYSRPRAKDIMPMIRESGIRRLIGIPLYPQYSSTTTRSSIDELMACITDSMSVRIIEAHYQHSGFIDSLSALLSQALSAARPGLKTHILFTAHSIPLSRVQAGDPYVGQVRDTVQAVVDSVQPAFPFSLAFQSRLGPVKWQGPGISEALEDMLDRGVEQLIIQPVSFISENLETQYDLDIALAEACRTSGIKNIIRTPTPGLRREYLQMLSQLVTETVEKWGSETND